MSAQIINLAERRIAREWASREAGKAVRWPALEAALMLNPLALLWLEALEYASRHATAPTVVMFEED